MIHKYTRDNYHKRFPELESLVQMPIEYVKTVKVCGAKCETLRHQVKVHNV